MRCMLPLVLAFTIALAEDLLKDFSKENIKFAADLYKHLRRKRSQDFLISPLSLQIILALVDTGAKGKTAQQLSSGLHLSGNLERTERTYMQLTSTLKGNDEYNLSSANKIYIANSFKIRDSFKRTAISVFDAGAENIDFTRSFQAASEINEWVENKTDNIIKNMVRSKDIFALAAAILINAIHFQGQWVQGFPVSATKDRPFHFNSKDQVDIAMMELIGEFNYYESSRLKAKFLEMPYSGKDVSMIIVLPNKVEGLRAIEGRIASALAAPQYKKTLVNVVLPKFKIETSIQFKPILQALGIRDAFEDSADFSGITDASLKIDKVIQKTFIDVDERGTTAAVGTVVRLIPSMTSNSPRPKKFIADHPFLFYLKEKSNIMFVGRYISGEERS